MNTSLVCLVLALSSSWSAPAAADVPPDRFGPTPEIFARAEPYGLFDEVLDQLRFEPDATTNRSLADSGLISSLTYDESHPASSKPAARRISGPSLLRAQRDYVIRAQNAEYRVADGTSDLDGGSPSLPQTYGSPSATTPVSPLMQSTPYVPYEEEPRNSVPMFVQPPNASPYMMAPPPAAMPGAGTWGTNGPQPYRLGYTLWGDAGWLPGRHTNLAGNPSKFEVFETNLGLLHTIPTWWSPWLFSLEHQFGYRSWQGPGSTGTRVDLPGAAYRLGWDIKFETPLNSEYRPFAFSFAFNPSINSDFAQQLGRQAFNFDGRGIMYWQADPRLLVAIGAGFWDRVHDRVVPYAGVVWLPDDRWEFRLMWPQSRIQWYAGNFWGEDVWAYASAEYHVESYQIHTTSVATGKDQIELADYRAVLGLRKSSRWASGFIEGGWVFGRKVDLRTAQDFSVNSGFIGRIGLKF